MTEKNKSALNESKRENVAFKERGSHTYCLSFASNYMCFDLSWFNKLYICSSVVDRYTYIHNNFSICRFFCLEKHLNMYRWQAERKSEKRFVICTLIKINLWFCASSDIARNRQLCHEFRTHDNDGDTINDNSFQKHTIIKNLRRFVFCAFFSCDENVFIITNSMRLTACTWRACAREKRVPILRCRRRSFTFYWFRFSPILVCTLYNDVDMEASRFAGRV